MADSDTLVVKRPTPSQAARIEETENNLRSLDSLPVMTRASFDDQDGFTRISSVSGSRLDWTVFLGWDGQVCFTKQPICPAIAKHTLKAQVLWLQIGAYDREVSMMTRPSLTSVPGRPGRRHRSGQHQNDGPFCLAWCCCWQLRKERTGDSLITAFLPRVLAP